MASFDDREIVKEIAKAYGRLVMEKVDYEHIYLYGSYAKGSYKEDSDIDIAVVGDGFSGYLIEGTLLLMKIRRKIDNRIEPRPF